MMQNNNWYKHRRFSDYEYNLFAHHNESKMDSKLNKDFKHIFFNNRNYNQINNSHKYS